MLGIWSVTKDIRVQKDFALAIDGTTPFAGLLFTLRSHHGNKGTEQDLRRLWLSSEDIIVKRLFKDVKKAASNSDKGLAGVR